MKKLLLFFSIALAFSYTATSQEFRMGDGRFATCSGNFVDSGGVSANYANSENSVITFCSPFPTDKVQVSFNSINLASGDLLFVYDGDAVAGAPLRVLTLGANGTTPVFLATAANTTGCLTFRFISDTSNNGAGWNATLACVDNCQTITSAVTTTPAPDADGILRLCQGESVNFVGTGNFSVSGANATYKYVFDDGTEVTGTTATRTYTDPGIYKLDFVVTDDMNCRDRSLEDLTILVSTTPDFTGTSASATDICFGDQVTLTGAVTTTQFFANVAPPISGQTFLPDGSGVAYQTCIDVSGFPNGRTFQNASDLINVFINMEHSYMGDLDIKLTAPNGSQVSFLTFPNSGGGRFLGMALDDGTTTPGVGLDYFFTETATLTLDQSTPGVAFGGIMPSGDYRPEDPFANFIGTPLNGLWCLDIVDNLSIDNGYIFEWGINFNPAIIPTAGTFTPAEVTEAWVANADIISTTGTDIVVQPSQAGQNCYVFELTDDFGCTYSETVCVNVAAEITSIDPTDIVVCQNSGAATVDLTSRDAETLNGLDATTYTVGYYTSQADAAAQTGAIATPGAYAVTANQIIYIRVDDANSNCFKVQEVNIVYSQAAISQAPDLSLCDDASADGVESFDLTPQTPILLGAQSPTEYGVTYFESQADADANTGAITTPNAYSNTSRVQTIFARVTNLSDSSCYVTGTFTITVFATPVIGTGTNGQIPDLETCDDVSRDGVELFDLTTQTADILGAQSSSDFVVAYFTSQTDADANTNAITNSGAFQNASATQTIFVRLSNVASLNCYATSSFTITVFALPQIGTNPNQPQIPGLDVCDDINADLVESFDLTVQTAVVLGTQNPSDFTVSYFESQADADANTGAITTPDDYLNTSPTQTIFVRVSNLSDADCYTTGSFTIAVLPLPQIGSGMDLTECDDSPIDGSAIFDLSVNDTAILNRQSSTAFTVTYHDSETSATSGDNPLDSTGATLSNGTTVYARITDNVRGCFNVSTFNIIVELCEVIIPEGFSPNNDGVNDTFSIPGLDQYSNFELMIFNRNGSKIFETKANNYVEFAGIPNRGLLAGDGLVPVGTYFYVLKFNDGLTPDVSSWVYINY